jgi:hypothetical protein
MLCIIGGAPLTSAVGWLAISSTEWAMVYLSISAKKVWFWISVAGLTGLLSVAAMFVGFQLAFRRSHSRVDELSIMRKRVDAKEVQAWAKQILRQHTNRTELFPYFPGITADPTMVLSNAPTFLSDMRILGRMGPSIIVSSDRGGSNRCVSLLYAESFAFGGDGHMVVAGDESYRKTTNAQCVEWIAGVYYSYVHSP